MQELENRPVYIQFEVRAEEDRNATVEKGYPVYKDVNYVIVTPPGGHLTVEKIAEEWLEQKRGDPYHNLYQSAFESWIKGQDMPLSGTAIELCPAFSPAKVKQIRGAMIRTVEDLAEANETTISRMGMGGRGLKEAAVAWLKSAESTGKAAFTIEALQVENKQLSEENAELKELVGALQEQLKSKEATQKQVKVA